MVSQQQPESVEIDPFEMVDKCRNSSCYLSDYLMLSVGVGGDLLLQLDEVLVLMVPVMVIVDVERTLGLTLIWTADDRSVGQTEAPD